jgi:hypothetical protein
MRVNKNIMLRHKLTLPKPIQKQADTNGVRSCSACLLMSWSNAPDSAVINSLPASWQAAPGGGVGVQNTLS